MPQVSQFQADTLPDVMSSMREVIDSVRYERLGVRIGGPGATIEGHWPALIVSMIVVFACFFAIGRTGHSGSSSHGEAPSTLQAASGRAAIPAALAGGPPIEGAIPIAIATAASRQVQVQPKPRSISTGTALSASAPVRSFTAESPQASTTTSRPESLSPSTSVPASAPAPSTSTGESGSSSQAPAKSQARSPASSSSGGGSFDSSE